MTLDASSDEQSLNDTDDLDISGSDTDDLAEDFEEEELEPEEEGFGKHPLEVRRTIEDHLERARLKKEYDYLFDESFIEDDEFEEDLGE